MAIPASLLPFTSALACAVVLAPVAALAKPAEITIASEADLRFGTFMVFGSGSRTVSTSGAVQDQSVIALEGRPTGPARFTLTFDRGNESRQVLAIEAVLLISPVAPTRQQGVQASVSAYETDIPGSSGLLVPGQPVQVQLRNCARRLCSLTFNLGARLDVTRVYGGADLSLPIPVDVAVLSVDRHAN